MRDTLQGKVVIEYPEIILCPVDEEICTGTKPSARGVTSDSQSSSEGESSSEGDESESDESEGESGGESDGTGDGSSHEKSAVGDDQDAAEANGRSTSTGVETLG
eukprot:TRINITY_DN18960_c0_g1_i1.p1 TRINITY_DN18960_c0_g1~~TRINITY_DN18960_c0_g1_i1.p1  ORF type:complete len:123 (+),score=13.31 TRINITY_DN18960_c0_g1_i1:57-371(+)